jgi:DNA-binding response OmpR family regulator
VSPTADGATVSAEELLEHVWDANADPFTNTVAVTIARLRRKLGAPGRREPTDRHDRTTIRGAHLPTRPGRARR